MTTTPRCQPMIAVIKRKRMSKKQTTRLPVPELLAPAGSFEKLRIAIHYGADAVYLGSQRYSLRSHATFPDAELAAAVAHAHSRSVKVYVTVNILARDRDFAGLDEYLAWLRAATIDGLIIADPGILQRARQVAPDLPVHLSTQANVTNTESARFWHQHGVARLNLARELSLAEIGALKKGMEPGLQLEAFVHGALCISYSGRCLLSQYLTGRDANYGDCAQPCRYRYALMEEKRPGQFFPVEEDEKGTYIFNSRDLCLLRRLPDFFAIGVDSLKIEGRMKSVFYVGSVVRVYRAALDYLAEAAASGESPAAVTLPPQFMTELALVGTRGYTENFADGPAGAKDMLYDSPRLPPGAVPAGIVQQMVERADCLLVEVRNPLMPGERLEYLGPGLATESFQIAGLRSTDGEVLARANPGSVVRVQTDRPLAAVAANGLLRKEPSCTMKG